jgi:Domain of unknown function (DUF5679)
MMRLGPLRLPLYPSGEGPVQAPSASGLGRGATFQHTPRGPVRVVDGTKEETIVANYEGYCVKCREKRQFEGQEVELANGRRAAQGTCPVCGTKMNRILGKKK